ncbi:uncharacterized protein LOC114532544 isoform X1 [Dendronephthya gigantea]|uniref:uncharacterized protein LOC114532544 isoform X1 n=1 Tax=Dendronephthya gigantea TaxID=151771 RepID=UPI00106A5ACD|nr:uncharacterized protein LOC114532544 isoform X1 [Dendronephthya gigantea]
MLLIPFCVVLATLVAGGEGISSWGGVHGKKRDKIPGPTTNPSPNRFLCPLCNGKWNKVSGSASTESKKTLKDILNLKTNDPDKINIHCVKGEKGDKGDVGGSRELEGTLKKQIEAVVEPLRAKLAALQSSYTVEIARLRNEVHSIKSSKLVTLGWRPA